MSAPDFQILEPWFELESAILRRNRRCPDEDGDQISGFHPFFPDLTTFERF